MAWFVIGWFGFGLVVVLAYFVRWLPVGVLFGICLLSFDEIVRCFVDFVTVCLSG